MEDGKEENGDYFCTIEVGKLDNIQNMEPLLIGVFLLGSIIDFATSCHSICSCNKLETKLTCSDVTLTSEDLRTFVVPRGITEVTFTNNNVSKVSADILHPFRAVSKLQISSNLIESIPNGTFQNFKNLTALILSNNQIEGLQGHEFVGLSKLLRLDLAGNYLVRLNQGIFDKLSSIASIELQSNKLEYIPDGVFTPLHSLRDLFIGKNSIKQVGAKAFQNMSMNKLELSSNKIKSLSPTTFLNFRIKRKILLLNNEMHCGCREVMMYAKYFKGMQNDIWATCNTPPDLKGKYIATAYKGTQCTMCDLNFCKNGASCQGNKTDYSCICAEQYKGAFCERSICKADIKYVNRYIKVPLRQNRSRVIVVDKQRRSDPVDHSASLAQENKELETKLLILYAICSLELVIILCFVGLLLLGKYQDWKLMKKYNLDKQSSSPLALEKFQWTPASELENLNGNGKGYISIKELVPYQV